MHFIDKVRVWLTHKSTPVRKLIALGERIALIFQASVEYEWQDSVDSVHGQDSYSISSLEICKIIKDNMLGLVTDLSTLNQSLFLYLGLSELYWDTGWKPHLYPGCQQDDDYLHSMGYHSTAL